MGAAAPAHPVRVTRPRCEAVVTAAPANGPFTAFSPSTYQRFTSAPVAAARLPPAIGQGGSRNAPGRIPCERSFLHVTSPSPARRERDRGGGGRGGGFPRPPPPFPPYPQRPDRP